MLPTIKEANRIEARFIPVPFHQCFEHRPKEGPSRVNIRRASFRTSIFSAFCWMRLSKTERRHLNRARSIASAHLVHVRRAGSNERSSGKANQVFIDCSCFSEGDSLADSSALQPAGGPSPSASGAELRRCDRQLADPLPHRCKYCIGNCWCHGWHRMLAKASRTSIARQDLRLDHRHFVHPHHPKIAICPLDRAPATKIDLAVQS